MHDNVTDSTRPRIHKKEMRWYAELNQVIEKYGQVCSLLAIRLKELAQFLNSLFKHKGIFGLLTQEYKDIQNVLQNSLELSRNLSNQGMLRIYFKICQPVLCNVSNHFKWFSDFVKT